MDIQLDPEQAHIVGHHAALAAYALHHGAASYVCDVQPGNGTRYIMVLTCLEHSHGNPQVVGGIEDNYVLSLPYFQTSYPVNLPGWFDPYYVKQKWTGNDADAVVVATFLNDVSELLKAARAATVVED
jgi:hypothetical protein